MDGENSRAIMNWVVSVCDPDDGLGCNFVVPNSNIAVDRVSWAGKPKFESFSGGDQNVAVSDGVVQRNGVGGCATVELEKKKDEQSDGVHEVAESSAYLGSCLH